MDQHLPSERTHRTQWRHASIGEVQPQHQLRDAYFARMEVAHCPLYCFEATTRVLSTVSPLLSRRDCVARCVASLSICFSSCPDAFITAPKCSIYMNADIIAHDRYGALTVLLWRSWQCLSTGQSMTRMRRLLKLFGKRKFDCHFTVEHT